MSDKFEQISLKPGFMKHNGGLLFKNISENEYEFKTTINENHLNAAGITHGGFIAAFIDGAIAGSLTLIIFSIPTGKRAWIEDVVVDEKCRNKGIGEALNQEAINIAKRLGAKTVDLTSRPSREAANRLYSRLGFVQRNTNIYRFEI